MQGAGCRVQGRMSHISPALTAQVARANAVVRPVYIASALFAFFLFSHAFDNGDFSTREVFLRIEPVHLFL